MSTTTAPTPEELQKQASRLVARKHQGFITHKKASGATDEEIKAALPKYAAQDAKRTTKIQEVRTAILGHA